MQYEIREIGPERKQDLLLPNEPFEIYGQMTPLFDGEKWTYRTRELPPEVRSTMCFPDEAYDYDALKEDHLFVGAYRDGACVGLAIYQLDWMRYLYLEDLKVNTACRGSGIGRALIEKGMELARVHGYRGVYTIAQDNNLAACRFYLGCGFEIGGLNTHTYRGTRQEGKSDIYFYRDAEAQSKPEKQK